MTIDQTSIGSKFSAWWHRTFVDLVQQLQWSYLPPLMVYFAAGVSGLTAIVGAFFVKDYLGLSAAFLAGLSVSPFFSFLWASSRFPSSPLDPPSPATATTITRRRRTRTSRIGALSPLPLSSACPAAASQRRRMPP